MPCSNLLKPDLNLDTRYTFEVVALDRANWLFPPETWAVWGIAPTVN